MKKVNQMSKIVRQGDVYIQLVPENSVTKGNPIECGPKGFVVAEGEATGHHHAVQNDPGVMLFMGNGTEKFVEETNGFLLHHEEHEAVAFPHAPEGMVYRIWQQIEYDTDRWTTVTD